MFSSEWVIQSWRARHWVMQDAMFSGWKLNLAPQACGVLSCCCSVEGHWHRSGWEWGGELELQMPESSDSVRVFNKASRQSPVWFALLPIKFSRLKKVQVNHCYFWNNFFYPELLTAYHFNCCSRSSSHWDIFPCLHPSPIRILSITTLRVLGVVLLALWFSLSFPIKGPGSET